METRSCLQWRISIVMAAVLVLGVAGCSVSEKAGAPPAASEPATRFAADKPAANSPGEAEWGKAVAAAKREGKLVLSGPPGESWRRALIAFGQDFPEIRVEYTGINSRDFWPRLFRERDLGQYVWDLRVGGPDPQVFEARDKGVLDPVRPVLLLPEVTDENKWFGGFGGLFVDKEQKYIAGFLAYASAAVYVNRDVVSEAEFRSDGDLTDPRWKGKIVLQDPRGGAGLGSMTVLLATHGEQFVRDLLSKQDVTVTGDNRPITGLPIPAYAEIAIEGKVAPPSVEARDEGPFGEWPGYYSGGTLGTGEPQPTIRVKALYHRNNPILFDEAPLWPGALKHALPINAGILWDQLESAGIQDIAGVFTYTPYLVVVAIRQRYAGHAKQAGLAALSCSAVARHGRYVVVVDEDIDPTNLKEVLWAMETRVDPARDIEIVDGCWSTPLDPRMPPEKRRAHDATNSRAIFYAVRPFAWRDQFPRVSRAERGLREKVVEKYRSLLPFPSL